MVEVVGIRFKKAGKIYYFDPAGSGVNQGDSAIVETARGIEYGDVVTGPREVAEESIVQPLKKVIRKASADDTAQMLNNASREKDAYQTCLKKIAEHKLPMKLVDVEFTFDNNKIIFYFTADGRIDFRELVKDLAAVFRTRIELRQIGVRDEAKMVGGLGCCGRVLCCHAFLGDFEPVSIRMAKEQNLSLNPTKISGACGRLMCCLKYENDAYESDKKDYPPLGTCLCVNQAEGKVCGQNILKKTVTLEMKDSRQHVELALDEAKVMLNPKRDGDANGAD